MNNVLITIGVLIVLVLSALFAVPHFVDWNSYRGVVEEEASRVIGRDVRIGGDITLQLLPAPSFGIQKLRIADAATGSGEPLFRADRVDVKLSIVPLVRGVLEANQIELLKPILRFVVDGNGQGNWRSLVQGRALPFTPTNVALQSVKITDGSFSVLDRGGNRVRLDLGHIEGQLSAPALEGPYRFRGIFGEKAELRDLRFTTLPPDQDGVVQFKASLKDLATSASATLDAKLHDLGGQPALSGELSALLPMPGASDPAAAPSAELPKRAPSPLADLKSTVTADIHQLTLGPLSVAFESSGRPEVLSGDATINWDTERTIVAKLTAPWIDLDNVLGNPENGNPLLALADFAQRINGFGTGLGAASAVLQIDQANLGHDLVGGIRVEARSSSGLMAIEQLHANLPGGTKVEMRGRIAGEGGATTFDGDMTMRGSSIARLTGWATANGTTIDPANDAAFTMRSRVTAEPARGGLRDIVAEVGNSTLEGEIDYAWRGARKLRLTIGGSRLDARALAPAQLNLRTAIDALTPRPETKPASDSAASKLAIALNLNTAELVLPDRTLRDVSAVMETSPDGVAVERLQFSGDHGIALSLEGRLGAANHVRGAIAAADTEGVGKLSDFLGLPLASMVPATLLPELLPFSLAGTLDQGAGPDSKGVSAVLDGHAGSADVKVRATIAGLDGWRTAPADVDIVLLAPQNARLAAKALAALRGQGVATTGEVPVGTAVAVADKAALAMTRLALRATGIAADGLSTAIRFDSPDLTVFVDGKTRAAGAGDLRLMGELAFDARDGRGALDAMGGVRLALAEPLALQGTAQLKAGGGAVGLDKIGLVSGSGTRLRGHLQLDPPAPSADAGDKQPPRRRLTGELDVSALDLASLLAPVLQRLTPEAQAAIQVTSGRAGVWPDANFDFSLNRSTDAAITLKAARLTMADNLTLADAGMTLRIRPGAIELVDVTGAGLGGRLTASLVLDANATGAALTGKLDFAGIKLAPFGATGAADLSLMLTGTGINPAGLVSGLTGKGALKLAAASLHDLTPATVQAAIDTALKAPPEAIGGALRTALVEDTARGDIAIGPRTLALLVQDGVIRVPPFTLAAGPGRVVTSASLDLATFGITGDWRVETRAPPLPVVPPLPVGSPQSAAPPVPAPSPLLPAVIQRFAIGPADIAVGLRGRRAAPETAALERELAVRKVERDLAELERLRRLDEERAAQRAAEDKAAAEAEAARQATVNRGAAVPEPTGVLAPQ